MTQPRTAWHYLFYVLLRQRGPKSFEIQPEVPIGKELPRADYLLLRKTAERDDDSALTLRGLWPRLPQETVVELKSIGRPYRQRGLHRLLAYAHGYYASAEQLAAESGLSCALIVPDRNEALQRDTERLGLQWHPQQSGYSTLAGGAFTLHVVEIDRVTELEDDDVLRLFSHHPERTLEAKQWWARHVGDESMKLQELEDYDEVMQKFLSSLTPEQRLSGLSAEDLHDHDEVMQRFLSSLTPEQRLAGLGAEDLRDHDEVMQRFLGALTPEQRLAGLAPEQRLAGLAPEQRLAGLSQEERLLGLPDEALRALSPAYVEGLPEAVRAAIHQRVGSPADE